jgi:hypothetical protein
VLLAAADTTTLNELTLGLVIVTGILAGGQLWATILQRRELRVVERQLDLSRQQIEVTREQLRAHLELEGPCAPQPGQLPTATVCYVSGAEPAADAYTWLTTHDGRRFGKKPNTPSQSRTRDSVTMDSLPDHLIPTWEAYFRKTHDSLALVDGEWWAAVTWQTADKSRYYWMYLQRVHYTETKDGRLPSTSESP